MYAFYTFIVPLYYHKLFSSSTSKTDYIFVLQLLLFYKAPIKRIKKSSTIPGTPNSPIIAKVHILNPIKTEIPNTAKK